MTKKEWENLWDKKREWRKARKRAVAEEVEKHKNKLELREYTILNRRYGIDDGVGRTLEEVGKEFGVTRERIRQIEAKALEKITRKLYK